MSETKYDFNFIAGALGLVPYYGGAINPAQITEITRNDASGHFYIHLNDEDVPIAFTPDQMAELEANIRKRQAEVEANQYEQMKKQIRQQAMAVEELNNRPQLAGGVPIIGGKRGRS